MFRSNIGTVVQLFEPFLVSYPGIPMQKKNAIRSFTPFQTKEETVPVMHPPNFIRTRNLSTAALYVTTSSYQHPFLICFINIGALLLVYPLRTQYTVAVCMYAHLWTQETKTTGSRADLEHAHPEARSI